MHTHRNGQFTLAGKVAHSVFRASSGAHSRYNDRPCSYGASYVVDRNAEGAHNVNMD